MLFCKGNRDVMITSLCRRQYALIDISETIVSYRDVKITSLSCQINDMP